MSIKKERKERIQKLKESWKQVLAHKFKTQPRKWFEEFCKAQGIDKPQDKSLRYRIWNEVWQENRREHSLKKQNEKNRNP